MGRPPDPLNKFPHLEFWLKAREFHKREPRARLRPAANLIGIFAFPFGWRGTEYGSIFDDDTVGYESHWRKIDSARQVESSGPGSELAKQARSFRRHRVEEILKQYLVRNLIHYDTLYRYNPKAPAYGRKPPVYPINPTEFSRIDVELSTVGRLVSRQMVVRVDIPDLISCLEKEFESRGRPANFDRGNVERTARDFIETWRPECTRKITQTAVMSFVGETESATSDDALSDDQLRPIVKELWLEYGLGK